MATRTQHARRNIITSVANKMIIMLANFVMRTMLIHYLGDIYLGLDSIFTSILQILSLTELGVGSAMVYSMYKPLAENDTPAVCALLKLYRFVYRVIALIVLVLGVAVSPFLPVIVKQELPGGLSLYALYFINLGNTVLTYLLFAYRSALFTADQQYSVNNNIYSIFKVASTVFQILAIIIFQGRPTVAYYLYTFALPLTTILKNLAVYILSNRKYPQYQCEGTVPKETLAGIKDRVTGMFLHRLSFVFRNSLDSIVLSAFLGLSVLAKYNSYYYVINSISGIMLLVSNSVTASVGNSIIKESKEKNYTDLKKIQLLYMLLTSWIAACLAACLQPFMKMWLGEEMMFSDTIMVIFCIYFYSIHFNRVVHIYRDAYGLWHKDKLRPIVETVVNLVFNILLVKLFGVSGVMLSTIFCIVCIEGTWGTWILYKYYFTDEKMSVYMLKTLWTWVLTVIAGAASYYVTKQIPLTGIPGFIVYGLTASVISVTVYVAGTSFLPEFKPAARFLLKVVGLHKLMRKIK